MKNFLFALIAILTVPSVTFAQNAEKDMKKAAKLLGSYHLDPAKNEEKLVEAKDLIDQAMASDEISGDSKAWNTKGEIYNAIANKESTSTVLDPNAPVTDAALVAYEAFSQGFDAAIKNYHKKDALKGMAETAGLLNTLGYTQFQRGNYESAYMQFEAVININKMLEANDMKGILGDDAAKLDQYYITAVSAMSAQNMDVAGKYFMILDEMNFDKPVVYEGLYNTYKEKDEEKALAYLSKGREKFPAEKSLLFTEINHYLHKGELESLIEKLETAAELEPDNASIFTTLGNVYDQQYQEALEGDDAERTESLFNSSMTNYEKALGLSPNDFAATYSIGALYYNKAAAYSKIVNELAEDYSKEGTKKYEAKKAEMDALFDEALPWFEKAEALQANDANTLIALKEIHARKGDFEKSNLYKAKIEALPK